MRTKAHVEWGVRCLRAGTWQAGFEPWLEQATWLTPELRRQIRRAALIRVTELVEEAHSRRDWTSVVRYHAFLAEVRDEPDVVRFMAARVYPHWVYHLKDRLWAVGNWLRSWLRWAHRPLR